MSSEEEERFLRKVQEDVRTEGYRTDPDGWNQLHWASASTHGLLAVRWLIQDNPTLVHAINDSCRTPLHWARTAEIAKCLVEEGGVNPFAKNVGNRTPREYAEWCDTTDYQAVIEYLKGAERFWLYSLLAVAPQLPVSLARELLPYFL